MVTRQKLFRVYQFFYFISLIVAIVLMVLGYFQIINNDYAGLFIFFILFVSNLINSFMYFRKKTGYLLISIFVSIITFFAFIFKVKAILN